MDKQIKTEEGSRKIEKTKKKKYTHADIQAIKEFICKQKNKHYKVSDVKAAVNQESSQLSLSISSVRRIMKDELHLSYK